MPTKILRKGKCGCREEMPGAKHTCGSCSTLALKLMKLVFALPEESWYKVVRLSGDAGMKVHVIRQLEMDFGSRSDSLEV